MTYTRLIRSQIQIIHSLNSLNHEFLIWWDAHESQIDQESFDSDRLENYFKNRTRHYRYLEKLVNLANGANREKSFMGSDLEANNTETVKKLILERQDITKKLISTDVEVLEKIKRAKEKLQNEVLLGQKTARKLKGYKSESHTTYSPLNSFSFDREV